jgi:hypothetical protein
MGVESPEPARTPTGAVFLSYASQDAEPARKIATPCAQLESKSGSTRASFGAGMPVVPLAFDGTSERSARVPDPFKHVQWMRSPGGETTPAFVEWVRRLLPPEGSTTLREPASAQSASAGVMQASAQASWLPTRWLLIAVAVAILATAVYFVIGKLLTSKPAVLAARSHPQHTRIQCARAAAEFPALIRTNYRVAKGTHSWQTTSMLCPSGPMMKAA